MGALSASPPRSIFCPLAVDVTDLLTFTFAPIAPGVTGLTFTFALLAPDVTGLTFTLALLALLAITIINHCSPPLDFLA